MKCGIVSPQKSDKQINNNSQLKIGDYIHYDPTNGVTDSSLLKYTSEKGNIEIYSQDENTKIYPVFGIKEYNEEIQKLVDENGKFDFTGYKLKKNKSGNGSAEQIFQATLDNNVWRIIGLESNAIKIVPEKPINTLDGKMFSINGLLGYIYATKELDNISAIFGHGLGAESAKSITVEDINNLTNYNPVSNNDYNKLIEIGNASSKIHKSYRNNFYTYSKNEKFGDTINSIIFGDSYNYKTYWLASYCVSIQKDNYYDCADFGIRKLKSGVIIDDVQSSYSNNSITYQNYFTIHSNGKVEKEWFCPDISASVQPVVTLKSNIAFKSGDGSKDNPWKFQDDIINIAN